MIRFIRKQKARKYIKQAWDSHRRLMWDKYDTRSERVSDIEKFADAIAELSWMTGAALDCTPPDLWED